MTMQFTNDAPIATESDDYLERAKALGPLIEAEAVVTEGGGRLSPKVVDALRESNLFFQLLPRELGGGEVGIVKAMEVQEEIARADGAAGWCFMVHAVGPTIAMVNLEASAITEMYTPEFRQVTAGFGGPNGTARRVEGGWMIESKRMSFGSGTLEADRVICGLKVVDDEGNVIPTSDGGPDIRFAYVPREKIIWHGNWDVSGLKGSGSEDYELPPTFLEERFVTTRDKTKKRADPLVAFGEYGITFFGHTGVALGIIKRGLEELSRIVDGKKRGLIALDTYPVFLYEYARNEAVYQAVRAYAYQLFAEAEKTAKKEGAISALELARAQQIAVWSHEVAGDILDFCYSWAGTEPIRNNSALGRAFRDLRVARNHFVVDSTGYPAVAAPILKDWQSHSA